MFNKALLFCIVTVFALLPGMGYASLSKPKNIELSPSYDSITVTWTTNNDDTDYYVIMWGVSQNQLNSSHTIEDEDTESYVIKGLKTNTTYYVKITAYDSIGNSESTGIVSTKTLSSISPPSYFDVTRDSNGITGLTEDQIVVTWDAVSDNDLSGYKIYYGISTGNYPTVIEGLSKTTDTYAISGLDASSRYYLTITSFDIDGKESVASDELIVDTLPDVAVPNTPAQPTIMLAGPQKILITFSGNNSNMADLNGYMVYITNSNDASELSIDIGDTTSVSVGNRTAYSQISLIENTTYSISISAYDYNENESNKSISQSIFIEDIQNILVDNENIKSSCFISSLDTFGMVYGKGLIFITGILLILITGTRRMKIFLITCVFIAINAGNLNAGTAKNKFNTAGVKVGYFFYTEKLIEDTYEDDYPVPLLFYYERMISSGFFTDIEAGFLRLDGEILTESNQPTTIQSKIDIFPASLSIGYKLFFNQQIYGYLGAGPDLWQFYEKSTIEGTKDKLHRNVAGYHVKAGIAYIFTAADFYEDTGLQLEVVYSNINYFGDSEIDFGGTSCQAGFFYRF
ncbi:MAG: fibronectin type III domain-containing protein [Proteobacteria bacterium]|nr:fibronectin type III domain-containing protein [Pseudomonadota bacterium]